MFLSQITTNISSFLDHFLFEILDEHTINVMENGIKSYLKGLKIYEYNLTTMILDNANIRVNLNYDDKMLTFFVGR
jgi:hypothetical protein